MRTPLITPEGYKQLQDELSNLLNKERPKTVEKVSWAASLGDRSENSDYIENKRKLRFLDRRIRYLSKRIPQLKIIKPSKHHGDGQCKRVWIRDPQNLEVLEIIHPQPKLNQTFWIKHCVGREISPGNSRSGNIQCR